MNPQSRKYRKLYVIDSSKNVKTNKTGVGLSIDAKDNNRPINADPDKGVVNNPLKFAGQICEGDIHWIEGNAYFSQSDENDPFLREFELPPNSVKDRDCV